MARVQYEEIACKSALNRVYGMPFKWSLNPYRGCVHGCHYCYARASHTYYGMNADEDFETRILVKVNFTDVLRQELRRPSWRGEEVALGTVTDCYQPVEGRYRLTRRVLEALLERRNPLGMVTKSPLVVRDLDLLAALGRATKVRVFFTITTVDRDLSRAVEPGTAPPYQRLRAMQKLVEAGVPAGVLLAPILPGITDSRAAIESVASAAAEHGADFFGAAVLRLAPGVKEHYFGFVGTAFPALLSRYQAAYPGAYAPAEYARRLSARVDDIRARHGFAEDSMRLQRLVPRAAEAAEPAPSEQLALPLGAPVGVRS